MFTNYYYPYYRSPYNFIYPGYYPGGYGNYYGSNVIGSAVANQNLAQVGGLGNIGVQTANPIVI